MNRTKLAYDHANDGLCYLIISRWH